MVCLFKLCPDKVTGLCNMYIICICKMAHVWILVTLCNCSCITHPQHDILWICSLATDSPAPTIIWQAPNIYSLHGKACPTSAGSVQARAGAPRRRRRAHAIGMPARGPRTAEVERLGREVLGMVVGTRGVVMSILLSPKIESACSNTKLIGKWRGNRATLDTSS